VFGSVEHLATMINNLLQNAISHANTEVTVTVTSNSESVVLSVCDDGAGVDEKIRSQIHKPFQRGETSSGYGLGLAIVSRIAAHHGAELTVGKSDSLGGAKFVVTFATGNIATVAGN